MSLSDPQSGDAVALFLGLYLGHILGDFVFQPGRLVLAKRRHQWAIFLHTAIVTACMAVVGAAALRDIWPAVLLAGVAHLGIDELTIRARLSPNSPGLAVFLVDQGLHVVSLVMISALVGWASPPVLALWPVSIRLLASVCAVATAAFAGSILIFEVQLSGTPRSSGPGPVLGLDGPRLYGMAERGGALIAALLLPVPALGALAFVPRLAYASVVRSGRRAHHLEAAGIGLVLCATAWTLIALTNVGS